jgi:Chaperone of endosialidase
MGFLSGQGSNNIALGYNAGGGLRAGDNNIYIGNPGPIKFDESDTIRIGGDVGFGTQTATFIAGIAGATVTGSAVFIDTTSGQLGLMSSSERFKDGIESMGKASEVLLSLRPVTFHYKKNIDPKGAPQFGLVAEDVEKVNPDLVVRDAKGKVFTVRYEAVNAMLLNEFLKEHRTVQEQQKEIKALAAQLKEQAALLQKVSDRLELTKPAPQMAVNNQ